MLDHQIYTAIIKFVHMWKYALIVSFHSAVHQLTNYLQLNNTFTVHDGPDS